MKQKRTNFLARWEQVVYVKTELAFYEMWRKLLNDYSSQRELCNYLKECQYPNRHQWAVAWTSHYRHYGTVATSAGEGKHKVLKDYIGTSQGNLLTVVHQTKEMILTQYSKYMKSLADAKHTIKFSHKPQKMPYLPSGIHDMITPRAIEHVRQQELLSLKHRENNHYPPCTHSFETVYGLPCYHTITRYKEWGQQIPIDQFDTEHWRYQRRTGGIIPLRRFEHIREPHPIQGRGRPRRNESSTRRDPSAFERPVPPTASQASQSIADYLNQLLAAEPSVSRPDSGGSPITVAVSLNISAPVSAPISMSVPVTVSSPVLPSVSVSVPLTISAPVSAPISISAPVSISSSTSSPPTPETVPQPDSEPVQQPSWNPPTLEEFLADIEQLRSGPAFPSWSNPLAIARYTEETGQTNIPPELLVAREMALDTQGCWADYTPTMAYNCHFGDREAFQRELDGQVRARHPFGGPSEILPGPQPTGAWKQRLERMQAATAARWAAAEEAPTQAPAQEEALQEPSLQPDQQPAPSSSPQRPQRATAKRAHAVWAVLRPQKKPRQEE